MRKWENVLQDLKELIGSTFDREEIMNRITDFDECQYNDEVIVSENEGYSTTLENYGRCKLWEAYLNFEDSTRFLIYVKDNQIVEVEA